jgi:hypothetical protein
LLCAGLARLVDGHRKAVGMLSACLLACVPWMQISRAASSRAAVTLGALCVVTAAGVAVHLLYLAVNMAAVRLLRIGGPDGPGCGCSAPALVAASLPLAQSTAARMSGGVVCCGLAQCPPHDGVSFAQWQQE